MLLSSKRLITKIDQQMLFLFNLWNCSGTSNNIEISILTTVRSYWFFHPICIKLKCDWILPLNSVSMGCRWWNSCSSVNNNSKPFDYSTVKMPFKGTFLCIHTFFFKFSLMNSYCTKSEYSNNLLKDWINIFFLLILFFF